MDQKTNSCQRCGWCCKSFEITQDVSLKIVKYLSTHPDIIEKLDTSKPPTGECIFLEHDSPNTTKCLIYNSGVRPVICDTMATKGFDLLTCPNGAVSDKYTPEEANRLLTEELHSSPIKGFINPLVSSYVELYRKAYQKESED